MDPDPGDPKTCGSGSPTLLKMLLFLGDGGEAEWDKCWGGPRHSRRGIPAHQGLPSCWVTLFVLLTKYLRYICRVQSCVWRLPKYWPPTPPLHPASVSSPRTKSGGYTLAGRWGVGGSIFWKTPDIGLASYSIISLRSYPSCGSRYRPEWICIAEKRLKI